MRYFTFFICTIIPSLTLAEEIPFRKAGLWEIEIAKNDEAPIIMKQCVDLASEQKTLEMSKNIAKDICSKNEIRKEGDAYISESDCTMANNRTLTRTVTSGDFTSHYESQVTVRSVAGDSGTPDSEVNLSANWIGECEPGQTPGQMIMSDSN